MIVEDVNISKEMFRMMRAVPRMTSLRQATIKSQTARSGDHKARQASPFAVR